MAKKKSTAITTRVQTVRIPPAAPANITVRAAAAPAKKTKPKRRHHGGGNAGVTQQGMQQHAIGGFVYGYIEKTFGAQIPTLPVIGRAGTIALAAYYASKGRGGITADVARAAAVIAGYQFGATGKVAGALAPQVSGIAAQV